MSVTIKQNLQKIPLSVAKKARFWMEHKPEDVVVSSSGSTNEVLHDSLAEVENSPTYYTAGLVEVEVRSGISRPKLSSITPLIGTVDEDGIITKVSDGVARFVAEMRGAKSVIEVDLTDKVDSSVRYVRPALPGSLAHHLSNSIESRLSPGMTLSGNAKLLSATDHANAVYTRNPNFWGADLDLTSHFIYSSEGRAGQQSGLPISPYHVITVQHANYHLSKGAKIRFLTMDNQVVERTIAGVYRYNEEVDYDWPGYDAAMHTLSEPLPENISYHSTFFPNWGDYIHPDTMGRFGNGAACMHMNQDNMGLVLAVYAFTRSSVVPKYTLYSGTVNFPNRLGVSKALRPGDSGSPSFLIYEGELVPYTLAVGRTSGKPHFWWKEDDIMEMVTKSDLDAGMSPDPPVMNYLDLSVWPNLVTKNYLIEDHDLANGNASLWVESGTAGTKTAYKMRLDAANQQTLEWTGSAWEARDTDGSLLDTSSDDVATPDLATFSTLTFTTP